MSAPSWQAPSVKKNDNYNYGNNTNYSGGNGNVLSKPQNQYQHYQQYQQQQQQQQVQYRSYPQEGEQQLQYPPQMQYSQPNYSNGADYYSIGGNQQQQQQQQQPAVYNNNININNGVNGDGKAAPDHPNWYYGICGCCGETGACCEAWCCYFCLISRTRNMINNNVPEIDCCICFLLCCFDDILCKFPSCCCQMTNRQRVRGRYRIPGGCCGDCCSAYCCPCCLAGQLLLEMSKRGDCPGACCCQESLPIGKQYTAMA